MKAKASIATNFLKVSADLEEALARAHLTARDFRIISWVRAKTYGVRVKTKEGWMPLDAVAVSHNRIAAEIGVHRTRVKESLARLVKNCVLRTKEDGRVGINSRLDQWTCAFFGTNFTRAEVSQGQSVPGQGVPRSNRPTFGPNRPKKWAESTQKAGRPVPGSENSRGELLECVEKRGATAAAQRPRPQTQNAANMLPNGQPDTMKNRAELGHADYAPCDHPKYDREDFDLRTRWQNEWQAEVEANEFYRQSAETLARLKAREARA